MSAAKSAGEPERTRRPRLAAAPQPQLRTLLPRGYAGFTEATAPRHLVLPATTSVPLIVKLLDSSHRPPAFVMGVHGTYSVLEGDCAPSYLEVWLAPLGAYTLLGLPMDELSGHTVDLVDVLGATGRRLAEQLRETSSWHRRFALLDQFLLRRLEPPAPDRQVQAAGRPGAQDRGPAGPLRRDVASPPTTPAGGLGAARGLRGLCRPGASGP
jgi:hypothetical protein